MRKYPFLLLFAALFSGFAPLRAAQLSDAPAASAETKFDPAIDDLPLMTGLTAVPDQDTLFTTPHAGRIAESVATGEVDIDEVYKFYHRTLPQLGWQAVDGRSYKRGGEKLRIDVHADGKITTVHFSVKPQ